MNNVQNLDKILGQIRHLIAKADHPNTPGPEAEMCRNRAETLMFRYRIEEAMIQEEAIEKAMPVWRTFWLAPLDNPYYSEYGSILQQCLRHLDCRGVSQSRYDDDGKAWRTVEAVGYDSEMRFADLLYTAASLAFSSRMTPTFDPSADPADMAFRLRASGMKRKEIGAKMFGPSDTVNEMKAKNRKVTALIKKGAEAAGEDWEAMLGRTNNIEGYRMSYVSGFMTTFSARLREMRMSRGADSGALVLASRKTNVEEALYERFPRLRPDPNPEPAKPWVDPRNNCPRCKAAKSGYCRDHAWMRPSRAASRGVRFNEGAYEQGASAARSVDLGKGGTGRVSSAGSATHALPNG
jgi:Protein of unknown function (DUF2786).